MTEQEKKDYIEAMNKAYNKKRTVHEINEMLRREKQCTTLSLKTLEKKYF